MQSKPAADLARTTFQLLALGGLVLTSFWIVRPFLMAMAWAAMIVVATWPLLLRAQAWLGDRRSLAVAVMTVALLLILLVPLYFGITAIVESAARFAHHSKSLATLTIPQPPAWLPELPLVGTKLALRWQQAASASPEEISARLAPFARTGAFWLLGQVGSLGLLFVHLLLTVVVVAILYANGETAARGVERFARRLAGAQGAVAVQLAARAVRAVALGVVVTAIVQSALVGIAFAVAKVPFAPVLLALVFILAIAQVGPALVLIPVTIWVYSSHGAGAGTVFLAWAIFCSTFDNFLRPVLIKRGADLPLLLIFVGVIGGLVAFGVIGLFVGPVVLAVGYTLLGEWVAEEEASVVQESASTVAATAGIESRSSTA